VPPWSYDATYQLTGEHRTGSSPYLDTYTYDPTGNRLLKIHDGARTTSVYDAANQLTYSQDASGRTTRHCRFVRRLDPSGQNTPQSRRRRSEQTARGGTFDADGNQQVVKAPNGDRTTYAWDYENLA
jgi:uncharacterized protein RhaS with RHS repeats